MEENKVVVTETEEVSLDAQPVEAPAKSDARGPRRPKGDKPSRGPRKNAPRPKDYEERVVTINRVSKTTKGGRRIRFTAVVVIGFGGGRYGYGNGKAQEVPDAIKKAIEVAKKNVFAIELVKGETIAHEVSGKFGACTVFLKPAPEGTGVIAGGPVRAILELAGIRNVYSKIYGSRTPLNVLKATDNGLRSLKRANEVKKLRESAA